MSILRGSNGEHTRRNPDGVRSSLRIPGSGGARSVLQLTMHVYNVCLATGGASPSNYFNRSWQEAYWGTNYSRLRAIKRKYDPEGLFFVHHGVGSEEWSADGFTRIKR